MNARKVPQIVGIFIFVISSTFSMTCAAEGETYSVKHAGYVNSVSGTVQADCRTGDEVLKGSCAGQFRNVSPIGLDVDYALDGEKLASGYACKPHFLRADQTVMIVAETECKAAVSGR